MRLVRHRTDRGTSIAVVGPTGVHPTGYVDLMAFIADDIAAIEAARAALDGPTEPLGRVLAPLPDPGKMLFLGRIFRRFRADLPDDALPFVYARVASSIIGPGEAIRLPGPDDTVLYEGELLIIIGRGGRAIAQVDAMDHVFGYTQVNDMTWTDWIHGAGDSLPQITMCKNADTFCPMGPEVVTADAFDPHASVCRVSVNGEVRTTTSTDEMVWSIPRVIEWLSKDMTLHPGDVIATGTSDAQRVVAGDEVVVEFEGLGRLVNPVVAGWTDP
jgi:2-keto-4-pentenoate hydratase/2-oxohepta-3-ene-1,7-dioic acid hydratase in catechol pathway